MVPGTKSKVKKCVVCQNTLKIKQALKCTICEQFYDNICANISDRRYILMNKCNKETWKCDRCIEKIPIKDTPQSSVHQKEAEKNRERQDKTTKKNISENKRKSLENLSLRNEDILSSTVNDDSTTSLPNLTILENSQISHLKYEIDYLKTELKSAHNEIDKLNIENSIHKKTIEDLQKKFNIYNKLLSESPMKSTSSKKHLKKPNVGHYVLNNDNNIRKSKIENKKRVEKSSHLNLSKENCILTTSTESIAKKVHEKTSYYLDKSIITEKFDTVLTEIKPRKVMIFADEQGRGLAIKIKSLLGKLYNVQCICKPGANMEEVLKNIESYTKHFSKKDTVIILGGINDVNQYLLFSQLNHKLYFLTKTNTIICQTPFNKHLDEKKLNYEIKFLAKHFENSIYLDMDYERYLPSNRNFVKYISQRLLKEILRISYQTDFQEYTKQKREQVNTEKQRSVCHQSTQTEDNESSISKFGTINNSQNYFLENGQNNVSMVIAKEN